MREGGAFSAELARLIADRGTMLLVVAHPDDDVLGAGALLARLPAVRIVYVTDGAPRDGADARAREFAGPAAYAAARRREALAALGLAGVEPGQTVWLDVPDQQATFALERIAGAVGELAIATRARMVLTHPYEGGHPDHDATAFAARAAVAMVARTAGEARAPTLAEFAGYHAAANGGRETSFLPEGGLREGRLDEGGLPEGGPHESAADVATFLLSEEQRRLKAAMLACHATQAAVLADFHAARERESFRRAPAYDFSRPPHAGPLLYEQPPFGAAWGIDGARWRAEAAGAAQRLGPA